MKNYFNEVKSGAIPFRSEALPSQLLISSNTGSNIIFNMT